jgi:hypothetical protein
VGERAEAGGDLGAVHARAPDDADGCARRVLEALTWSEAPVPAPPLVYDWYGE